MSTKSLSYHIVVLFLAALMVNQIACSNASFNKSDDSAHASPGKDYDGTNKDNDDEKTVRCDSSLPALCDVGDTGVTARRRSDFEDDNCFRTTYTFSDQDYLLESKIIKFELYDDNDNVLRSSDIEKIDGVYTLVVEANGRRVGYDVDLLTRSHVVAPSVMGQVIELRYCTNL